MKNNPIQVVSHSGVLPSYLKCFEKDRVHLICAKKPSLASDNEEVVPEILTITNEEDESIEKCDLTGDPLKVDLGDENDSIQIIKIEEVANRWSAEELRYFPLPVRAARREINNILKKTKSPPNYSMPTYVVCNAEDLKKTVLLGGNNTDFMACSIHALGTVAHQDVQKKIEEMVDDHLKNCFNGDCQVKYFVKITYNLYGRSLRSISCQNEKMRQLSTHGNISVNIVSPKKAFKVTETDEGTLKMYLELVTGHPVLRLHFLWNELLKLQRLIDILSNSDRVCDETVICQDPLDSDVILQNIVQLLSSKFLMREREKDIVDLDNLRQEDLLDGLWNVLIRCDSVSVLRDSFNFLFEELAEGSIKFLPIKDDCSKVSTIIKGILQGKIGLSKISLLESIEMLFELGAQKLKFDFQVILAQFVPLIKTTIDLIWKAFYQKDQQESKKSRRTRATRVTYYMGTQNLSMKISQLGYLSQLYVGSEFIYLLKDQVNLNDDAFHHFYRCVEKEYVSDRNLITDFNEIYESPLKEISFDLDIKNASVVESVLPSRWTVSMETKRETTIYDLSDSPIFPPVIYDYNVPISDTENMLYYVTKMSRSEGIH